MYAVSPSIRTTLLPRLQEARQWCRSDDDRGGGRKQRDKRKASQDWTDNISRIEGGMEEAHTKARESQRPCEGHMATYKYTVVLKNTQSYVKF